MERKLRPILSLPLFTIEVIWRSFHFSLHWKKKGFLGNEVKKDYILIGDAKTSTPTATPGEIAEFEVNSPSLPRSIDGWGGQIRSLLILVKTSIESLDQQLKRINTNIDARLKSHNELTALKQSFAKTTLLRRSSSLPLLPPSFFLCPNRIPTRISISKLSSARSLRSATIDWILFAEWMCKWNVSLSMLSEIRTSESPPTSYQLNRLTREVEKDEEQSDRDLIISSLLCWYWRALSSPRDWTKIFGLNASNSGRWRGDLLF